MSRVISIDIDLADHPALQAEIDRRAEIIAAEEAELDDPWDDFSQDINDIRDAVETVRRHLTSPKPNPAEAMIYVERALVVLARVK